MENNAHVMQVASILMEFALLPAEGMKSFKMENAFVHQNQFLSTKYASNVPPIHHKTRKKLSAIAMMVSDGMKQPIVVQRSFVQKIHHLKLLMQ